MANESSIKWFKFYLEWYEVIKELPDNDRLSIYDFLCKSAQEIVEGTNPTFDESFNDSNINPSWRGWVKVVVSTIQDNVSQTLQGKKRMSEGARKAMENRWNKQPESEPQQYNGDIANRELKELRSMLVRNPQRVKTFCQNEDIPCVNVYFAFCFVFISSRLANGGNVHKDTNDLYTHFTSWFIKIKEEPTFVKIVKSAQNELRLWNRDFPQGKEDIYTCDIAKIASEFEEYTKTK